MTDIKYPEDKLIEYPKDKLYLRVGNLIREVQYYASKVGNLEAYAHIRDIDIKLQSSWLLACGDLNSNSEYVIKTENYILSPEFLTNKFFRESDKEKIKSIIRDYKLNQLV